MYAEVPVHLPGGEVNPDAQELLEIAAEHNTVSAPVAFLYRLGALAEVKSGYNPEWIDALAKEKASALENAFS